MDAENSDLFFPTDDLLQFQEEEEEAGFEEEEMDFEEMNNDDLFDDPYIFLTIF